MKALRRLGLVGAVLGLAGCFVAPPKTVKLFRGEWQCGRMQLEIQEGSYRNGTEEVALRMIEHRGDDGLYTLFLTDGREIRITAVTETSMTLLGENGRKTSCQRIGAPPLPD